MSEEGVALQELTCAVIVTIDANAEIMPDLEAHAQYGLTRLQEFNGFVHGALHKSADGTGLRAIPLLADRGGLSGVYP